LKSIISAPELETSAAFGKMELEERGALSRSPKFNL